MDATPPGRAGGTGNDACQVDGRRHRAGIHNHPCEPPRLPLLPKLIDDVGQLLLRGLIHDLVRCHPLAHVEAHVQRPRPGEAESPFRRLQVSGRHPQVEEHPVRRPESLFFSKRAEVGEADLGESNTVSVGLQPPAGRSQRPRVQIDAEKPRGRLCGVEDRCGVSALSPPYSRYTIRPT